ncbi:MAG: branched-chain amino acid ABC transporter permease [Nitrososphaerota archaeon]|nr:branched-chain amino acid ABC transporter permease [Nitrososphaerota archaeon]
MTYDSVIQLLIISVLQGGIYGLIAVSLSLVLGVQKIINIAHGDLMVFAAYIGLSLAFTLPLVWILVPVLVITILGFFIYRYLIMGRVSESSPLNRPLLITIGVSFILENIMLIVWTTNTRFINTPIRYNVLTLAPRIQVPLLQLLSAVVGVVAPIVLWVFLYRTKLGKAIRATALDSEIAKMMGINTKQVEQITFAIAMVLAGIAGLLVGMNFAFEPDSGLNFTLLGFAAVTVGGVNSIQGSVAGGFLLSLFGAVAALLLGTGFQTFAMYMTFIIVLLIKPTGFMSRSRSF